MAWLRFLERIWGAVAIGVQEKNLDPACVGSAYLFLKKKKDIRLRRALSRDRQITRLLDY